jgi:hypothetical protein
VDFVPLVVDRGEAGRRTDRAVDVDDTAAQATDQMMMVVADAVLEARRRSGGLNAPEETTRDQNREGVVHGLEGDGADLGPDDVRDRVRGDVRMTGDRAQDRQALGRDLYAVLAEELGRVGGHRHRLAQLFE